MTDEKPDKPEELDKSYQNQLTDEDQARVDEFISKGVNSVERKPFRVWRLLLMLLVVVTSLSVLSQLLAKWSGVY
ncbi:MAG: DUF3094 family protein [Pseudomonadota bacterium]